MRFNSFVHDVVPVLACYNLKNETYILYDKHLILKKKQVFIGKHASPRAVVATHINGDLNGNTEDL